MGALSLELIGVAGLTNELKQTYDRRLLAVAEQNLVFNRYGLKRPIPARGGKSVEFRRFEKFAITTHVLTEGTSPDSIQGTVSKVQATISQYGAWAAVTDLVELQSFDPVVAEYTDRFGVHAAEVIDGVTRDILSGGTAVQYADSATVINTSGAGAVGSGNYLDASELLEGKRTLRRLSAKPVVDGKIICVVHPDNTKDLFEDADIRDDFKDAAPRGGDNPLFTGELGDWMGIRFVETTNLKIRSSAGMSGADIYDIIMFGAEAYGVTDLSTQQLQMIVHGRNQGGHTDPLEQYSTIGWKAAMAAVRLNENWLLRIHVASSRSTAA